MDNLDAVKELQTLFMLSPYRYRPLDKQRREIRLISILNAKDVFQAARSSENCTPSGLRDLEHHLPYGYLLMETGVLRVTTGVPILCEIEHVSLDQNPKYVALSYTWGDPTQKRPIVVDNELLEVTENLYSALQHLGVDETCKLWIDAICINQEDDQEKNWQVQQMWSIYHTAATVLTWVGPAADDSDLLIDQLMRLDEELFQMYSLKDPADFAAMVRNIKFVENRMDWQAFSKFWQRPYWSRVWIQQELLASDNIYVHCGLQWIHFTRLFSLISLLFEQAASEFGQVRLEEDFLVPISTLAASLKRVAPVIRRLRSRDGHGKSNSSLLQLLQGEYIWKKNLQASDPRDRIYGLLGLSTDAAQLGLFPNYSKTCVQVYTDVAKALIKQEGLSMLAFCNYDGSSTDRPSLPSWAPDWSRPIQPWSTFAHPKARNYFASRDAKIDPYFDDADDGLVYLILSGVRVDAIANTGETMVSPQDSLDAITSHYYGTCCEWLSRIKKLSRWEPGHSANLQYRNDALWRVPIADIQPGSKQKHAVQGQRALATSEEAYRLFLDGIIQPPNCEVLIRSGNADFLRPAAEYMTAVMKTCGDRRFFVSKQGYLGLGPAATSPDNIIIIGFGTQLPFVLQPADNGCYKLLGEAYVHGIMDGEFMDTGSAVEHFRIC